MTNEMDTVNIPELENIIGVKFNNTEIITLAFTHKSYAIEKGLKVDNERLEFLGDSVLSLIVSNYLYKLFSNADEGYLSKIRSKIISKEKCNFWAQKISLGNYLLLGKGEEVSNGRMKKSNLANCFEAFLGAVYLDCGYEITEKFFLNMLIAESLDDLQEDYKSVLQEIIQKKHKLIPKYKVIKERGPQHSKIFFTEVLIKNEVVGSGEGNTKKEAEQMAAKDALKNISEEKE
jgi:ribonuclease III